MTMRVVVLLALIFIPALGFGSGPAARLQTKPSLSPDSWVGTYTFGEIGPRNSAMVVEHTIKIFREKGVLVADIDADGFQTLTRLRCDVKIEGNTIDIVFNRPREENMYNLHKKGEPLLTFEKTRRGQLLTRWKAYEPVLKPLKNGRVYFTKEK